MKKLLLVLISFFTLTSFVNSPNYSKNSSSSDTIPYNNFLSSYGYKTDRMWLLNGLVIPVSDTTFGTDTSRVGAIVYKPSDSTLYIWNGFWSALKGGGGTSVNLGNSDLTNTSETQIRTYDINNGGLNFIRKSGDAAPQLQLYPTSISLGMPDDAGSSWTSRLAFGKYNWLFNVSGIDNSMVLGGDSLSFFLLNGASFADTTFRFSNNGKANFELYKNNASGDSVLSTNENGDLVQKYLGTNPAGTGYIFNTTTEQSNSNFFISDKGTIAGSLSVRGDSLWVPTKDITLTSPASNIYRIFSNTNITNSSHITLPVEGVDIHAAQFGLSYTGSADVDSSIRNQISSIRGAMSLAGTGGSGSTFSAELSPLSGIGATLSAFNNNHYTDAADIMAAYPYTYTATGLALFSGTIDNFYQIYLQGKVTNDIDANITNKWGIYQASTYPNKFGGGLSVPILATTLVSTTITTENYTCIYTGTSSAADWTIPAATTCIGSVFHFVAQAQSITLSQSYISLSGTSGQTSVAAGSAVTIQSDGTNWYQIQ